MRITSILLIFTQLVLLCKLKQILAVYPPNFHNLTGCLYTYMNDGQYKIAFPDGSEPQHGVLNAGNANLQSSKCVSSGTGMLSMTFNGDYNMEGMTIEFQIKQPSGSYHWTMDKVVLKITPNNKHPFPHDTIDLKPPNDIYAGSGQSYSCSGLVLQNALPRRDEPQFKIILKRFQVQPFGELSDRVFAPSHDCSVWLTLPQIMGFILVLFIIFTALIGIYMLLALGNQSSDLRFNKQGGMLMNQAQLDATKAD